MCEPSSKLWNPSPPASENEDNLSASEEKQEGGDGEEGEEDGIGDTVFSKSWALSVLVRAVETVSMETRESEKENEKEDEVEEEREEEELDKELEDDLCHLWDASMNDAVALYLHEVNAVDLLLGIATRSRSLRLTEVCVGLLGNLACQEKICGEAFSSERTRRAILLFLSASDTRILYEATRTVLTCIQTSDCDVKTQWLEEIRKDKKVLECLEFIMKSSTNEELLCSTGALVDNLLDEDDELISCWCTLQSQLVECLCLASQQTVTMATVDAMAHYIQCLHTLTTNEMGVACLVECSERVAAAALTLLRRLVSMVTESGPQQEHQQGNTVQLILASLSLLLSLKQNSNPPPPPPILFTTRDRNLFSELLNHIETETITPITNSIKSIIQQLLIK